MVKNKTIETQSSVADFVINIKDDKRRNDFSAIIECITENTGLKPKMWGTSIVGFGAYHYKYESGHEGDAPIVGIASRANAITFYLSSTYDEKEKLLSELGKFKMGKGCIYVQKIEDIDMGILIKMVKNSIKYNKKQYPG